MSLLVRACMRSFAPDRLDKRVNSFLLSTWISPGDSTPVHASFYDESLSTASQKKTMPTYHIEMMEGRTVEQKKKLAEAITRVSVEILGGEPDSVDILITDVKRENWATGGKLWSEPRD